MSNSTIDTVITFIKERLERIDKRLSSIEAQQAEFRERFIEIDARKNLLNFIIKNWWKILAVLVPALFFLGEIALHIRKLV